MTKDREYRIKVRRDEADEPRFVPQKRFLRIFWVDVGHLYWGFPTEQQAFNWLIEYLSDDQLKHGIYKARKV